MPGYLDPVRTSCSHPPWALKVDPRYLNVLVCFSVFPAASLIVTVSGTLEHTIVSVLLMFTLSPLHSSVLCQNGFASPSQFAPPMPGHLHTACPMEPPCRYALIQHPLLL